jgi:hypothetical protein
MEAESMQLGGRLVRFFSNPAIGIAGSIASIVGLVLAVYFYQTGQRSHDLRYFVHPAKAVVVKAGQSSRLQVTVDGVPVERDVTAAQVAFWNEGKDPIRSDDMLRGLVIQTSPKSHILEARLRKVSRDVTHITLDLSMINEGEVRVDWRILERHDGGILQVIYSGDADTRIVSTATVEGQGDVHPVEYGGSPEQYQRATTSEKILGYVYLGTGLTMFTAGIILIWARQRRGKPVPSFFSWAFFGVAVGVIIVGLFLVFWLAVKPGPPFGFE